jgi:hydroxyacylglutathione hydrolase
MQVAQFTFNDFSENTYVLYDETKCCAIIDPGCFKSYEQQELSSFIIEKELTPVLLVNTHCHIDHVLGNAFVSKKYQLPLHLHQNELQTYEETARWGQFFGLVIENIPTPQVFISETDKLLFGNTTLDILFTPGHSIASLSFYHAPSSQLIAGDVLFYQSIGRTDLPGGDYNVLINSIKNKLFTLPEETIVYSGHGPKTSIGYEKKNNPFLNQ